MTSIGDFISLFATLSLLFKQTGDIAVAAYGIPLKSFGIAMGSIVYPKLSSVVQGRTILIWSQIFSAACVAILGYGCFFTLDTTVIFAILTAQTAFKQLFEIARESISKGLGKMDEQRGLQAQILHGLYGAHFLGPIISFVLIENMPLVVPFGIDFLSFVWAAIMCKSLPTTKILDTPSNILKPIRYLCNHGNENLKNIFLLRSIGYWIPVGLFNYLLFSVVYKKFSLGMHNSAFIYAATGFGSIVATTLLRGNLGHHQTTTWIQKFRKFIQDSGDANIAFTALCMLAATRIGFINAPTFALVIAVTVVAGFCNGLNAVSTQSLRRKVTTNDQFGEIVALESVLGRLTDWAASSLALYLFTNSLVSYELLVWICAIMMLAIAFCHRKKGLRAL